MPRLLTNLAGKVVTAIIVWALIGGGSLGTARSLSDVPDALDELSGWISNHRVTRLQILHIRDDIETRSTLTPEMLRRMALTRVVFDDPWDSTSLDGLLAALKSLRNAQHSQILGVKWGILFMDSSGKELSAIFLSSDGTTIFFQGIPLRSRGALLAWIRSSINHGFDLSHR